MADVILPPFTPRFIFEEELSYYGLPTPQRVPEIMSMIDMASSLIDEECGRFDGDGAGSLVYSTYIQRILKPQQRNLIYLPMKPMVAVDQSTVATLSGMAASGTTTNNWYTGVMPNFTYQINGVDLSAIISASGRYGYTRQDRSNAYPDLFALINPINLVTIFGGPAPWVSVDVGNIDYDKKTGECWIPAGLQLQAYSEILILYNSGYNPLKMPPIIKSICASVVKNMMLRGNSTTSMMSMRLGGGKSGASATFSQTLIDPTLDRMLTPFKTVRAY